MITNFNQFINENLLVPRNLEGRKEKLKQMNIKMLSQEVIECEDLVFDESFMDIDPKFVKLKKVNGNVLLTEGQWTEIPAWLNDVEISGTFDCSRNKLTTLKNCPQKIGRNLDFTHNNLKTLKNCPQNIIGYFSCADNQLMSLEEGPKNIEGKFWCYNNQLTSLEGCPETVGGGFYCEYNKVKLELPDYVKLKGKFYNSLSS